MNNHLKITQDYLKSILDYNAETGVFTWKVKKANWINIGSEAGRPDKDGYIRIGINGTDYRSHRLAWLYVYGEYPSSEIDHINTIRHDNRIVNLRLATRSENKHNRTKTSKNTSGYKGVNYHKYSQKWRATISKEGKQYCLGYFHTPEDASLAYKKAAKDIYGNYARGD